MKIILSMLNDYMTKYSSILLSPILIFRDFIGDLQRLAVWSSLRIRQSWSAAGRYSAIVSNVGTKHNVSQEVIIWKVIKKDIS